MARPLSVLLLAFSISCQSDQGLNGAEPPPPPVPNPAELENPVHTDVIVQASPPVVDVLWAIDNSCSMNCVVGCHDQSIVENVTENFPVFMDHFEGSGILYHIGVVTTDMDDPNHSGKLQYARGEKFIDPDTIDAQGSFTDMALQGTTGSGNEKGFGAIFEAGEVLVDSFNAGFYRTESSVHTIVFSNEDDKTTSISDDEFIEWYDEYREPDKRSFSAVVCTSGRTELCVENSDAYVRAANEIGGLSWDIENEDWAALLDNLGAQAAGLKREYYLSRIPVPDTIEVEVETAEGVIQEYFEATGDPPEGDWTYEPTRNSIFFLNMLPAARAKIIITYELMSSTVEGLDEEETVEPTN